MKRIGILGLLIVATSCGEGFDDMAKPGKRLFDDFNPMRGKLGWSDSLLPGPPFPPFHFGPEKTVLKFSGDNRLAEWLTIYVRVGPQKPASGGQRGIIGPVVGSLRFGVDGADVNVEFDCQTAQELAFDPTGATSAALGNRSFVNELAGDDRNRDGLTAISFYASAFDLTLRLDWFSRTVWPDPGAPGSGEPLGTNADPVTNPVPVSAWAAYGRHQTARVYRTIIISNENTSSFPAGGSPFLGVVIPIPVAAKRFRVFRTQNLTNETPPVDAELVDYSISQRAIYHIPANDWSQYEIPRGVKQMRLHQFGTDVLKTFSVEFELEL